MRLAGFLGVLVVAASVLAGCSDGNGASGRTEDPDDSPGPSTIPRGPGATLTTASGAAVEGAQGTRCWQGAGFGGCVDYLSPVTNAQPLVAGPGEALTLGFTIRDPDQLRAAWMEAPAVTPATGGNTLAWPLPGPPPPLSDTERTLRAPGVPGRYVLLVSGVWQGQGDVTYGFFVEVP